MPSLFSGIGPYIESPGLWQDFHHGIVGGLRDDISDRLPDPYFARIDERMRVIEIPVREVRQILPDIAVLREREVPAARGGVAGTLTLKAEIIPLRYLEEDHEAFIEIVHLPERRVVTVIEVLSPSNKSESGRSDYLAKRNVYIQGDVHIVEVDLLVGGHRLPMRRDLPSADYFAFVSRAERRPDCEFFAWSIRRPLPTVPIPSLAPDSDILIELGPIFTSVCDRARYSRSIDYKNPLALPIAPEDLVWAEAVATGDGR